METIGGGFAVLFALGVLFVPAASIIIWFKTKNPNSVWLNRLYWIRFFYGFVMLIVLGNQLRTLRDAPNDVMAGRAVGAMIADGTIAFLLMRRWRKRSPSLPSV